MSQYISDFNKTAIDLCKNIALICPTSLIGRNVDDVCKVLNSKTNKNKFIDMFVLHVLSDKDEIMNGNDKYFLNKSYEKEFGNEHMSSIFEFKDIWLKLSSQEKSIIIQYMQILCMLADAYFMETMNNLNK